MSKVKRRSLDKFLDLIADCLPFCIHRHTTFPRMNKKNWRIYVNCLDCGKTLRYRRLDANLREWKHWYKKQEQVKELERIERLGGACHTTRR